MNHTWEQRSRFSHVEARVEVYKCKEDIHGINYHVGQRRGNNMSLKPPPPKHSETHKSKLASSLKHMVSFLVPGWYFQLFCDWINQEHIGRKENHNYIFFLASQLFLPKCKRASNGAKKFPTSQFFSPKRRALVSTYASSRVLNEISTVRGEQTVNNAGADCSLINLYICHFKMHIIVLFLLNVWACM